jgi:hypothetical protein
MPPKKSKVKVMAIVPSEKRAHNVLTVNDRVKILYLLKDNMSLAEAGQCYRKNE